MISQPGLCLRYTRDASLHRTWKFFPELLFDTIQRRTKSKSFLVKNWSRCSHLKWQKGANSHPAAVYNVSAIVCSPLICMPESLKASFMLMTGSAAVQCDWGNNKPRNFMNEWFIYCPKLHTVSIFCLIFSCIHTYR